MSHEEKSLTSIGNLAAQLQRPVDAIRATVARFDIRAELRLNGVPYYDAATAEKIADAMKSNGGKS